MFTRILHRIDTTWFDSEGGSECCFLRFNKISRLDLESFRRRFTRGLRIPLVVYLNGSKGGFSMNEENRNFMQAYNVADVSKMINVPSGTIRQWEKSLEGVVEIPRDEKGARYYTDFEIDILRKVKIMREKGLVFDVIREVLNQSEGPRSQVPIPSVPVMNQSEAIQAIHGLQEAVRALSEHVELIVQQEVRKEVATASEHLSEQIRNLSEQIQKQQDAIETVITETRTERHRKKSFWEKVRGK